MKSHLQNLIKINGAISVASFMNEVLFHPEFGYYTNSNPFGKKGDFITSPEISQVFGELIGAYFVNLWQGNYQKSKIHLVEAGAGRGTLMKDLLNFAQKIPSIKEEFKEKVSISIIEISPKLQQVQKQNLQGFKVNWYSTFEEFFKQNNDAPIFFVANELFDCFSINQFIKTKDGWAENMVGVGSDQNLQFVLRPTLSKELGKIDAKIGDVFEESVSAKAFMEQISEAIRKTGGVGIIIDYGYEKSSANTLQALKNHQYSNVLENLGESDITALVDFSALKKIAENHNLKTSFLTQREFLISLGILQRKEKLLDNKNSQTKDLINSSIDRLIDPKQMGDLFKVLIIW